MSRSGKPSETDCFGLRIQINLSSRCLLFCVFLQTLLNGLVILSGSITIKRLEDVVVIRKVTPAVRGFFPPRLRKRVMAGSRRYESVRKRPETDVSERALRAFLQHLSPRPGAAESAERRKQR